MKFVTSQRMREIDRAAVSEFKISGEQLMERAGTGVAAIVAHVGRAVGCREPSVLLVAGRGNNGGDAFVAARCLSRQNVPVEVWLAGAVESVKGDALTHLTRMKSAGVTLQEFPTVADWEDALDSLEGGAPDIVVDGVLGTGVKGPARGPAAGAIRYINELQSRSLVIAIDIPSGLDADTGAAPGSVVKADVTATMGFPKTGLIAAQAADVVGNLEVIDIGIPSELVERVTSEYELVTAVDLRAVLPRRPRDAHKGTFGHVLIVGGAAGYTGAAALATRAALRSGVGRVSVLTPQPQSIIVSASAPEAMVRGGATTPTGSLSADALSDAFPDLTVFDAVLVGPGMTQHEDTAALVDQVLAQKRVPVVLDADALNVCAGRTDVLSGAICPLVLTPHPGEMARLQERTVGEVQADRFSAATRGSKEWGATVVLKGAGTIVTHTECVPCINMTGNPGMATGGTGDVLAGLLAGLLAQGVEPYDAGRLAVYLQGRAGDSAAWRSSQAGLTAGDLIEEIPFAFRELTPR